jgi:stage V sporulation protein G
MKITAKIHRIIPDSRRLKAIAEVTLDGEFVIHNVRVVESKRGLFAAMPSYIDCDGEFRDHCFPITRSCSAAFDDAVVTAYRQACESLIY